MYPHDPFHISEHVGVAIHLLLELPWSKHNDPEATVLEGFPQILVPPRLFRSLVVRAVDEDADAGQAIWNLLAARGLLTPAEISTLPGQPGGTTRSLLLRMTRDGQLTAAQGHYRRAGDVSVLLPAPED